MTSERTNVVLRAEGTAPIVPAYTGNPIGCLECPCPNTII